MAKRSVVSLLACCLLLGTVVKLLIPAYTQEKPTCCGLEAHVHTEDCYERVLSCGLEEDETHTHSEACCTRVLTCQLPEHAHSLACYADPAADLESEAEEAIETTEETAQPVETEAPAEPSAPAQTEPTTEPTGPELIVLTAALEDYTISVQLHTLSEGDYQLSVTPLTATQEQIRQVEESQAEELPGGVSRRAEVDDADLLLFDICILDENGLEYQPEETVRVNVCQNRPAQAEKLPAVVHFSEEGPESLDVQEEEDGFGFDTDGFSVYAFAFTVDFYYEGFEYHLPGEGSILLSQLLTMLCIERDVSKVASVSFSDPTLISVTRQGSDWLLTSLASFDTQETLTVVMENGDTYSIDVTDPKGYSFYFNVNDSAAGCVYSRSTQYGESLTMAVTNDGVCQSSVRPRSAETPTNGNFTASYGYEFQYWVRDGYIYHGRGNENPSTAGYLYDIQPQVGQYGVEDRATTFAGFVMRLDLPFPSDEFIFGRLRMWNEFQEELNTGRRIIINGEPVPQEKLTPEYFDVRWYVLKDQQNSYAAYNLTNGDTIRISYTATMDENAVIGAAGNPNAFTVEYSNNPTATNEGNDTTTTTETDLTTVFTFKLVFDKVDGDGNALTGADFILYKWIEEENAWIDVTTLGTSSHPTKTVDDEGAVEDCIFTFSGLDDGRYKLHESVTPAGYNSIADIEFEVIASHDKTSANPQLTGLTGGNSAISFTMQGDTSNGSLSASIVNESGAVLPTTGGTGTLLLVLAGTIIALGGGVVLVTRRRMLAE